MLKKMTQSVCCVSYWMMIAFNLKFNHISYFICLSKWNSTISDSPVRKVSFSKPSEKVGRDYLGPITVLAETGMRKCWAIHLGVVHDLTVKAFLSCLLRIRREKRLSGSDCMWQCCKFRLVAKSVGKTNFNWYLVVNSISMLESIKLSIFL